ncbi:NAD(P)/FAD-dependent oxidoreductase [Rhizobium johnstonii]|uniref:NAD(P)/FAD-dependent oxidoreductase n=1 Tax=Rhizobium TaxID=379 RepID=UPI0010308290|nr:FAD-binding oxidoreductase [Rhizobium leguminosarum]TBF46372.1 FAD-binding oxidoreductase [Rhizobium leguminosarum]TBF86396.1 FAD-binding oxidoreductase [Rhizobium leguminosarum]TBG09951.1 FAD-binding oxidoreductase [Rhizobium leguminosarum]TBG28919.1 FAD-binding oxidoreductase [Rhizobium leguminosarum]TBG54348.1 FAD-binding oxidoreductase [Rhizobium leguminosarum]
MMTAHPPFPDIASLWQETAADRPVFDALSGGRHYDVAIIGGGYTGLSTARYLARRGLSAVVLEASRIGWGASGRNGGVVSGKFRLAFSEIAARYGTDTARRMHDLGIEAIDHVGELVEDYGIAAADYQSTGSLRCAHNAVSLTSLKKEVEWLHQALGDRACSILSAAEMEAETGSRDFLGGMLNTHGGIIHPLNFVFGIAAGLKKSGIDIFENTPVTGLRREGPGVLLETPGGTITAGQAVIASNSYSDLTSATSAVRKAIIPFRSAMIATAPLSGTPGAGLLAQDRSYTETRRMMRWFRKAGDRLLYGGRGAFGRTDSESAFAVLHRAMVRQFPELAGVAVTHRWSGLVAMTMDSIPHAGRLDDRIVYAVGYNGTGVALASNMGKHIAAIVVGESPDLGLLTSERLKPVPFYPIREPAVRLVAGWYQFLDAIGR